MQITSHHVTKAARARKRRRTKGNTWKKRYRKRNTVGNPLTDPTFRALLSHLIWGEIERVTGRTPWNANRDNVPPARITGIRLNPVVAAHEHHVNRVIPEDRAARSENRAENEGIPQIGQADTRTLILNFLIAFVIINFMLNILILSRLEHLISLVCKIEKGTKSILWNNSIAQTKTVNLGAYTESQHLNCWHKKGALERIVEPPF